MPPVNTPEELTLLQSQVLGLEGKLFAMEQHVIRQAQEMNLLKTLQRIADNAQAPGRIFVSPDPISEMPVAGGRYPERSKGFLFRQTSKTGGTITSGMFYIDNVPYTFDDYAITVNVNETHWVVLVNLYDESEAVGTTQVLGDTLFGDFTLDYPGWVPFPIVAFEWSTTVGAIVTWKQYDLGAFHMTTSVVSETKVAFAHSSHTGMEVTLLPGKVFNKGINVALSDPDGIEDAFTFDLSGVSPVSGKILIYLEIELTTPTVNWRAVGGDTAPDGDDDTENWSVITLTITDDIISDWKNEWVGNIHITRTA